MSARGANWTQTGSYATSITDRLKILRIEDPTGIPPAYEVKNACLARRYSPSCGGDTLCLSGFNMDSSPFLYSVGKGEGEQRITLKL